MAQLADKESIPQSQAALAELLKSPRTADRLRAVDGLVKVADPDAVSHISECLKSDPNENLRLHCVDLLAGMGPVALRALGDVLIEDRRSRSVRARAAAALGLPGSPALEELSQAARGDPEDSVRSAAVLAIAQYGGPEAAKALLKALESAKKGWLQANIIHALGQVPDSSAIGPLKERAGSPDSRVAKAAITALARIDPSSLIALADDLLNEKTGAQVRRRLAAELGDCHTDDIIGPLARALVGDRDDEVRRAAAESLARRENIEAKLSAIVDQITLQHRGRADLPCAMIVRAARYPADATGAGRLTAQLLSSAVHAAPPLTGILADILVANADGDPDSVGSAIDAYEAEHQIDGRAFENLRVEVGGTLTLDPILKQLREDLRRNFQEPISELNRQTTDMWMATITSARRAFIVRTLMSICVFVIGVALIAASVVLVVFNKLTAIQAAGSGTAFAGGLAATLLTVYSGPLKDIRQSISDLGAANVAFIAFVHQVLQVSHTFTAHYMRESVSFDEAQQAAGIISSAAAAATAALAATGSLSTSARSSTAVPSSG